MKLIELIVWNEIYTMFSGTCIIPEMLIKKLTTDRFCNIKFSDFLAELLKLEAEFKENHDDFGCYDSYWKGIEISFNSNRQDPVLTYRTRYMVAVIDSDSITINGEHIRFKGDDAPNKIKECLTSIQEERNSSEPAWDTRCYEELGESLSLLIAAIYEIRVDSDGDKLFMSDIVNTDEGLGIEYYASGTKNAHVFFEIPAKIKTHVANLPYNCSTITSDIIESL